MKQKLDNALQHRLQNYQKHGTIDTKKKGIQELFKGIISTIVSESYHTIKPQDTLASLVRQLSEQNLTTHDEKPDDKCVKTFISQLKSKHKKDQEENLTFHGGWIHPTIYNRFIISSKQIFSFVIVRITPPPPHTPKHSVLFVLRNGSTFLPTKTVILGRMTHGASVKVILNYFAMSIFIVGLILRLLKSFFLKPFIYYTTPLIFNTIPYI